MKYAGLIKNDIAAGKGVNVTFFTQGCHLHCPGCHNPQTWDFDGGMEFTGETLDTIIQSLKANDIQRNLSIMGGEPMADENLFLTQLLITEVRKVYPDIQIYLWSGYTYEQLIERSAANNHIAQILNEIDFLIDGPFIQEERDITLAMRGSRNQRIINMKEKREYAKTTNSYI